MKGDYILPKKKKAKKRTQGTTKATGRNYRKEYDNYQGKPDQIKKRTSRNKARAAMKKAGKVKKGDGKDVTHKNGNPKDNKKSNLGVQAKSKNRSYARTKKAKKKNKKD